MHDLIFLLDLKKCGWISFYSVEVWIYVDSEEEEPTKFKTFWVILILISFTQ